MKNNRTRLLTLIIAGALFIMCWRIKSNADDAFPGFPLFVKTAVTPISSHPTTGRTVRRMPTQVVFYQFSASGFKTITTHSFKSPPPTEYSADYSAPTNSSSPVRAQNNDSNFSFVYSGQKYFFYKSPLELGTYYTVSRVWVKSGYLFATARSRWLGYTRHQNYHLVIWRVGEENSIYSQDIGGDRENIKFLNIEW